MRGKAAGLSVSPTRTGITPAYAGKRQKGKLFVFCLQDHPRLCGEKVTVVVPLIPYSGSPPPMRGKADVVQQAVSCIGITPAYAGKSPRFTENP